MEELEIEVYETSTGKRPFAIWLEGLKYQGQNFNAFRSIKAWKLWRVQEGVSELRIPYGPGVRIY